MDVRTLGGADTVTLVLDPIVYPWSNADMCCACRAVLLATDGLFDNLFLDDILSAIAKLDYKPVHEFVRLKMRRMKEDRAEVGAIEQLKIRNVAQDQVTDAELQHAEKAARTVLRSMSALLAVSAQTVGEKPTGDTPFSKEAPTKWKYEGGKPDDVVVLLGVVIPDVDA